MKTYSCARHHERGSAVYPITIRQPMEEVEGALVEYLQTHVLTGGVLEMVLGEIRKERYVQLADRSGDVAALEEELREVRTEQKRLAKAVAMSDDIPELLTELRQRLARIQHLEAQLAAAQRTPAKVAALMKRVES